MVQVKIIVPTKPPIQNIKKLQWEEKFKVKSEWSMGRGAVCAKGVVSYFNPVVTKVVHQYDYFNKQWSELPQCCSSCFALVVVGGLLTTVGGRDSKKLFSFSGRKWMEIFPPMPTKRERSAAVCTGHSLVVAGGREKPRQALSTVEVMDTNTLQWSTAASLPRGLCQASITSCGDYLYLLGDDSTNIVYSSSLPALLQSCQIPGKASTSYQTSVWNRLADLPVIQSTAVTLCGWLISVGGHDDIKKAFVNCVLL